MTAKGQQHNNSLGTVLDVAPAHFQVNIDHDAHTGVLLHSQSRIRPVGNNKKVEGPKVQHQNRRSARSIRSSPDSTYHAIVGTSPRSALKSTMSSTRISAAVPHVLIYLSSLAQCLSITIAPIFWMIAMPTVADHEVGAR